MTAGLTLDLSSSMSANLSVLWAVSLMISLENFSSPLFVTVQAFTVVAAVAVFELFVAAAVAAAVMVVVMIVAVVVFELVAAVVVVAVVMIVAAEVVVAV